MSFDSTESAKPAASLEDAVLVPFSWSQQFQFIRKELRETLRDRRTIVTLLAMPLLLYPLLGLGFRFVALQESTTNKPHYLVAFVAEEENDRLQQEFALGQEVLERRAARAKQREMAESAESEQASNAASAQSQPNNAGNDETDPDPDFPDIRMDYYPDLPDADLEKMVGDGTVDLAVRVHFLSSVDGEPNFDGPVRVDFFEDRFRPASRNAADFFMERINANSQFRFLSLGRQLTPEFRLPVQQQRTQVTVHSSGSSLIGLLPLVLLLMTVTGGVYPAIDLTAGERERNTLETLVSMPVPKFRLLLAKFTAVVVVTLLTGLMNLIAMSVTLYALQLDRALLGPGGFTFGLAVKLLIALSAFGLFYSALLLMLTSSARSFKEAQAYLIPLLLLSIGPGMLILMPGWQLNGFTSVIPLVNILLLSKQFLEGTAELLPAIAAIVTTVLYGLAALGVAAQIFGADAFAVGSRGRLGDVFQRGTDRPTSPTTAVALIGLACLFPAYFVVSGILARGEDIAITTRLITSAGMTIALFLLFPILLLRFERVPIVSGLGLRRTSINFLLAGLLLGCSTWPWIFEIIVVLQSWGLHGIELAKFEAVQKLLDSWKEVPLTWIVLTLGVVPGVCEECFFRGLLFNGLRRQLRGSTTIIVTAVTFGLFHVVLAGGAAPERILPSTLMGLLLGWLRWRSGSLLPGIVLHAIHNSCLLSMAKFREELSGWGLEGVMHESHLPATWLGIAGLGFILGFGLAQVARRSRPVAVQAPPADLAP